MSVYPNIFFILKCIRDRIKPRGINFSRRKHRNTTDVRLGRTVDIRCSDQSTVKLQLMPGDSNPSCFKSSPRSNRWTEQSDARVGHVTRRRARLCRYHVVARPDVVCTAEVTKQKGTEKKKTPVKKRQNRPKRCPRPVRRCPAWRGEWGKKKSRNRRGGHDTVRRREQEEGGGSECGQTVA